MAILEIICACLPEETLDESAAWEFANRSRRKLESIQTKVILSPLREETTVENENSIYIFLISCAADGSVHRCTRKFLKKIKEESASRCLKYCIALLGHSVCRASAEQMNEQVFVAGRRLSKTLLQVFGNPIIKPLETQVELVAPDDAFDPWVASLITKIESAQMYPPVETSKRKSRCDRR